MEGDANTPPRRDGGEAGAFFGRRKSKRLRGVQEQRRVALLPELRIALPTDGTALDPAALFEAPHDEFWLEIGFGGGEHLTGQAQARPRTGFLGCEPFVNGVVKLLRDVELAGLRNVRVYDDDAMALLAVLPDACVGRVYLLYPDPWPKRRQRKRRFVSPTALDQIARVLKPGGLFRFASDIDDYVGWTLAHAASCSNLRWTAQRAVDWREPWSDWIRTRYEAKALAAGRPPSYLEFERTG